MKTCQLQDAKARLSHYVSEVETKGPLLITVRGRGAAVLIGKRDYERRFAPQEGLLEFFRRSPLRGESLELKRDRTPVRRVRL